MDQLTHLKNFCLISLGHVIYKIVTKVLMVHIRLFLNRIIGPLQESFIPGIGTPDNIIMAQEVFHWMH